MPNLEKALAKLQELPRRPVENTAWIVLTGAPSTGKSTLLEKLRGRGYPTRPEQAREFLEQEIAGGKTMKELTANPEMLVRCIFERNLKSHGRTSRQQVTLFDRGLPDVLAFGLVDHVDIDPYIQQCGTFRFVTAYVLERVPADLDRLVYHSQSQLNEIERACEEIYRALGAHVRRLPAFSNNTANSATQRMAVIEQEIRRLSSCSEQTFTDGEA
jgi:predicted ATPase